MAENIAKKIEHRLGASKLIELLSEKLSGSALSSLLMEVFARKTAKLTPPQLLKLYETNRFVHPALTPTLSLLEYSLRSLQTFRQHGFQPLELSPVTQLGACSVVATVDQGKVLSALRNCEVLADATNALALYSSYLKKHTFWKPTTAVDQLKFSTVERHVRTPPVRIKGHTAHFKIACLTSSGKDIGNFDFEKQAIADHMLALEEVLRKVFLIEKLYFKIQPRDGYAKESRLITEIMNFLHSTHAHLDIRFDAKSKNNNYYQGFQFKTVILSKDREIEIADGGLVDWTQQLLGNSKERFLISGLGLELLTNMKEDLI
jgi:hypothetical protein